MTAHETTPSDAAIGQASDSREARMVVVAHDGDGKPTVWCDPEIVDLVTALNNAGIRTVASCSGHGEQPGNIALADGRELIIAPSFEAAREIEQGRGALPELPRKCDRVYVAEFDGMSDVSVLRRAMDDYYTADQLLAYGEACRRMGNRDE